MTGHDHLLARADRWVATGQYDWPVLAGLVGELAAALRAALAAQAEPDHEYPERGPGFLLGYYEGWADAKAGRQYGEGQHGQRSGIFAVATPIVEDPSVLGETDSDRPTDHTEPWRQGSSTPGAAASPATPQEDT